MENIRPKILVTGGCGYIGGHTIIHLVENGFDVISVDNLSRGSLRMLRGVENILGRTIKNYKVDLCDLEDTEAIFMENPDIVGVIHFAAYKSVPESMADPLLYFHNNLTSLTNLLQCVEESAIPAFVFSSSCSVYGNTDALPVKEDTPLPEAESPYGRTKQIGETICKDTARLVQGMNAVLLRYFNPVGAHPSATIGEMQEKPENIVPVITQTAIGKRESMDVFGTDYPTRDGSCVRDYIHVMDIAAAHTKALQYLLEERNKNACEIFNLGTGNGVTVLELIAAFEKVSGQKLAYNLAAPRAGDVVQVYADNTRAAEVLGWVPEYDIEGMMDTAWRWEQAMQREEKVDMN